MTPQPDPAFAGWVIRVLGQEPRRQSGLFRRRVAIGHALGNDLVFRTPQMKGRQIVLDLEGGEAPARLEVLEGEANLLGQVLFAPAVAFLPPYTPLSVGGLLLAYGAADHPRWAEAERLAQAVRPEPAGDSAASPMVGVQGGRGRLVKRLASAAVPYAPLSFVVLGLACVLAATNSSMHSVAQASPHPRPATAHPLDAANGANEAEGVFASLGIPAQATADRRGGVTMSVASDADPMVADQARRMVLRDNPAFKRVDIAFGGRTESAPAAGRKRIVAAVSGPDSYLVASDGSKYFPGARLPTGQRLKTIDQDTITFEQDGVTTHLNLQNQGDLK